MTDIQNQNLAPASELETKLRDSWLSPIKGLDYLVDYYAVLGVARNAGTEEIHAAFRRESAQWHPDRLAMAAPQLRAQAENRFKLLTEADEVLTVEERRENFDRLLAAFPEELISNDGTPIINLKKRRINLQLLLNGLERDVTDQTERLKVLSGHDENTYKVLEQLVQAAGRAASRELLDAFRTAAEKRYVFMSLREEITATAVGLENQPGIKGAATPEEHVTGRREQIKEAAESAVTSLRAITALLPGSEAVKLLAAGEQTADSVQSASPAMLEARLRERMSAIEGRLLGAAEQTAEAANALLALSKWHYVPAEPGELSENLFIAMVVNDKVVVTAQWQQQGGNMGFETVDWGQGLPPAEGAEEIRRRVGANGTVAVLEVNKELDYVMQLVFVMRKHFENLSGEAVELVRNAGKEPA